MTKVLLSGLTLFAGLFSLSSVSASCFYQEEDPRCMINGQTRTSSCQGWSDTSSWSLPTAYDGMCLGSDISLTDTQKDRINLVIVPLFEQYSQGDMYMQDEYFTLTDNGQDFVNDQYFPAITSLIKNEVEKTTPDLKKLAILYYLSSIVGYDYSILKLS